MLEKNEDLSIIDILKKIHAWSRALMKNWLLMLSLGFICAILGLVYSYFSVTKYKAELIFAIEEKNSSGISSYSSIASQFGIELGSGSGGVFFGDNILELIKSRLIIEKTLLTKRYFNNKEQLLINRYIEKNNLQEKWKKLNNGKPIIFNDSIDRNNYSILQDSVLYQIIDALKNKALLVNKIDKKLNLVNVSFTSTDELFAKEFTEALVQNVSAYYIDTKTQKMRVTVSLLQDKVDSVRRELYGEMSSAALNQDQNINIIRSQARVPAAKKQMNIQMLSTMYAELLKNLELSKFTLMREEPLIQIIDRPILPLQKLKVGKIKSITLGFIFGIVLAIIYVFGKKIKETILNNEIE